MANFYDITGAVESTRVFVDNQKIGDDLTITLPDLPFQTNDYRSTGTINLPLLYRLDSMEFTISKVGLDQQQVHMISPGTHHIDCRWSQTILDGDSNLKSIGCKAFVHGVMKTVPEGSIDPGSASSNDYVYEVLDYQLFIDGKEAIFVDKRNGIIRINGIDQTKEIRSHLD